MSLIFKNGDPAECDNYRPISLMRRYGVPKDMLEMIAGLFKNRKFYVRECGVRSDPRSQRSGISQGCTLSPLLFVMVMSVLLHDAVTMLGDQAKHAYDRGELADVVYADDTLLIGSDDAHLTEYVQAVAAAETATVVLVPGRRQARASRHTR